jgi:hypothetical protein
MHKKTNTAIQQTPTTMKTRPATPAPAMKIERNPQKTTTPTPNKTPRQTHITTALKQKKTKNKREKEKQETRKQEKKRIDEEKQHKSTTRTWKDTNSK